MSATTTRLLGLLALWLVLLAALAIALPGFFRASTVTSVLQFSTILALVTLGQSLVVLSGGGGIDLSVGGVVSLCGLTMAAVLQIGWGAAAAIAVSIALGAALGLANGVLVTRLGIVPLIATLGSGYVYAGLAIALTGGAPIRGGGAWLTSLGRGLIGIVPAHFALLVLPAYALAAALLRFTPAGPWIYALGGNETAARLTGIPTGRVRTILYGASGLLAGLAAVVATAWFGSARPNIGQNLELESLTAALLGGVAITGGSGGVAPPLAAVLFLISLKTGIQLANLNTIWQVGTIGLLLVASVLADRFIPGGRRQ
ncbi:MAG TPA: ABC transporter permease [Roseiarcus sp.]|nr:ABC transporter permease [Roseiarcus sp.]